MYPRYSPLQYCWSQQSNGVLLGMRCKHSAKQRLRCSPKDRALQRKPPAAGSAYQWDKGSAMRGWSSNRSYPLDKV
jgi:hypothetical protein